MLRRFDIRRVVSGERTAFFVWSILSLISGGVQM